jgi:hypothetical protein
MNDLNRLHYTILGDPATGKAALTSLGNQASYAPWTTGGTNTAYTLTPTPASTANATGQRFRVTFNAASGATPTLAVSGQTAKSLKYYDSTGAKQAITSTQVPINWISDVEYDGTDWVVLQPLTSVLVAPAQDFRLTLTTAVPVTTADVTGATTIYCTPYKGNRISLYDGTNWNVRTSAEFSLGLGTITSAKPYDVFCYDNAGTPTLEFLAWTNDTTRATALAYQDGVLVKSGATTRRYLGTFYTTSTTQTEDSAANRYLWNYYHRVYRAMKSATETANSWTYTTATWRQSNANAANQLNYVCGVLEDAVTATAKANSGNTTTGVNRSIGIGVNVTNAFSGLVGTVSSPAAVNSPLDSTAVYQGMPGVGRNYLAWLEFSEASGTTTWYGDGNTPTYIQTGIVGGLLA